MTATTPLWLTAVVAAFGPLLTLLGVYLTQRAADRRAEREAEHRATEQSGKEQRERLFNTYVELLASSNDLTNISIQTETHLDEDQLDAASLRFSRALLLAEVLGPETVTEAAREVGMTTLTLRVANEARRRGRYDKGQDVIKAVGALQRAVRTELTGQPAPDKTPTAEPAPDSPAS